MNNHFAKVCRSAQQNREVNAIGDDISHVHITADDKVSDTNDFYVGTLACTTDTEAQYSLTSWKAELKVNGKKVLFKLDTGRRS